MVCSLASNTSTTRAPPQETQLLDREHDRVHPGSAVNRLDLARTLRSCTPSRRTAHWPVIVAAVRLFAQFDGRESEPLELSAPALLSTGFSQRDLLAARSWLPLPAVQKVQVSDREDRPYHFFQNALSTSDAFRSAASQDPAPKPRCGFRTSSINLIGAPETWPAPMRSKY